MNYEDMNDFEVNKAVAFKIRGRDAVSVIDTSLNKLVRIFNDNPKREKESGWVDFDPCNNPSDAWPIIVENNITIELSPDCTFEAYSRFNGVRYGVQFGNRNKALHSAMICFLKMKDTEK